LQGQVFLEQVCHGFANGELTKEQYQDMRRRWNIAWDNLSLAHGRSIHREKHLTLSICAGDIQNDMNKMSGSRKSEPLSRFGWWRKLC